MQWACILSTGSFLPEKIIKNDDLSQFSPEARKLIAQKTGVQTRRHAGEAECTSDLAIAAARHCLQKIDFPPQDVQGILLSTSSPDRIQPATSTRVQHELGARNAFAFDINSVCSGSSFGITVADFMIRSLLRPSWTACFTTVWSSTCGATATGSAEKSERRGWK